VIVEAALLVRIILPALAWQEAERDEWETALLNYQADLEWR
jgi:hypothetical protein